MNSASGYQHRTTRLCKCPFPFRLPSANMAAVVMHVRITTECRRITHHAHSHIDPPSIYYVSPILSHHRGRAPTQFTQVVASSLPKRAIAYRTMATAVNGAPKHAGVKGLLLGLPPDARAEDIEYLLGDVLRTLSRLDSKRVALQDEIAAASRGRGKRRALRRAPPPVDAPGIPSADALDAAPRYTRKGVGAVRRRLRATAGDVKKEREWLEGVWGDLEEALVDAKERLALQPGEQTA
ncbi:hypothetical protein PVAP13_8KG316002 [Panicum virgatum]|uniref:Uncharacterized protein n=1 Tax=Panicum virgatum TaxID=38727 RepID=A0A8T0PQT6_PANVG|nr:hypothetical protein PVAP13_8KG316002 [Panicum virgatum]